MNDYIGDFTVGSVIRIRFNTLNQSLIPATPTVTMTFVVYKNSVTEITAGITPSVDYDGRAGFHMLTIDTSADPAYVAGEDYDVVFTAGTVDGKDLSRVKLRTFSIENRNRKANATQIGGQTVNASTAVTFPGSIASQPSVDAIPTNPLLTTDTRLNNLNAPVGSIPTNPLLTTDTRLNNLDFPLSSINTAIGNLNNLSALINLYGAPLLEIPDAGNIVYAFTIIVRDNEGKLVNLDASPTLAAANASGTSRTSNLSAVTNPATGRYTFTYTVASTHPKESLRITASGTVSGEARYIEWVGNIVDYDTLTTLQQVQTTVNSIDTRLPSSPAASGDIPAATTIRDVIMNSMPNGGWVDGSFGDRWLISTNNTRELAVTGSGHIAAVLHDAEPNSIPDDAFTTAAITRIQNGLALQTTLLIVDKATRLIPALL